MEEAEDRGQKSEDRYMKSVILNEVKNLVEGAPAGMVMDSSLRSE
jgi:hypothetical protein